MGMLHDAISDPSGQPSTMRLLVALVVIDVMVTWTVVTIKAGTWQPLDWGTVTLVLSVLGVKAWQRGREEEQ